MRPLDGGNPVESVASRVRPLPRSAPPRPSRSPCRAQPSAGSRHTTLESNNRVNQIARRRASAARKASHSSDTCTNSRVQTVTPRRVSLASSSSTSRSRRPSPQACAKPQQLRAVREVDARQPRMRCAQPVVTGGERRHLGLVNRTSERRAQPGRVPRIDRAFRPKQMVRSGQCGDGCRLRALRSSDVNHNARLSRRQRDVVRRSVPLDFIRLEECGLERTWCDVERDRACLRQHLEQPLGHAGLLPKVAVDPMMQRRGLPT